MNAIIKGFTVVCMNAKLHTMLFLTIIKGCIFFFSFFHKNRIDLSHVISKKVAILSCDIHPSHYIIL